MQQHDRNTLLADSCLIHPLTLGLGSKGQNFTFSVTLHIKLKIISNVATWYEMFCPQPPLPPTLRMGSIGQNSSFSEHGLKLHIKFKRIMNAKIRYQIFCLQTLLLPSPRLVSYRIKENHQCSSMMPNILP